KRRKSASVTPAMGASASGGKILIAPIVSCRTCSMRSRWFAQRACPAWQRGRDAVGPERVRMLDTIDVPSAVSRDVIALRRDLHMHPELGFEEIRTAGIVADRLTRLGYEVRIGVGETGVVGILRTGRPGRTVLLRA